MNNLPRVVMQRAAAEFLANVSAKTENMLILPVLARHCSVTVAVICHLAVVY